MKKCSKCKDIKDTSLFQKDKQKKDGLRSDCKDCNVIDYIKTRRCSKPYTKNGRIHESPELAVFNNHLIRNYDITLDRYNQLAIDQKYCCAICDAHQDRLIRRLSVDHNHITGEIRGLLCWQCNAAIGRLRTDEGVETLQKAIKYINKSNSELADKKTNVVGIHTAKKVG